MITKEWWSFCKVCERKNYLQYVFCETFVARSECEHVQDSEQFSFTLLVSLHTDKVTAGVLRINSHVVDLLKL